jgi:hypothetical protein
VTLRSLRNAAGSIACLAALLTGCGDDTASDVAPTDRATDDPTSATEQPADGAAGGPDGVTTFEVTSRDHTEEDLTYPQTPPVGGDHFPGWWNCGVYTEPLLDEPAVHSLEHGAVWLTFDPAIIADAADALAELAQGQTHVLVSPYPEQGAAVVATAWGVQQRFEELDIGAVGEFIVAYQQGPQTPEPGAVCSGALGEPS